MVWWIAAASAVASIASSMSSASKGEKAAEEAGEANAAFIRMETAEQIRRTREQQQQLIGQSRALVGGTGVMMSGTPQNYMSAMETEQTRQLEWMESAGESRAQAALKSGQYTGSAIMNQAYSQGIGTIGSFLTTTEF